MKYDRQIRPPFSYTEANRLLNYLKNVIIPYTTRKPTITGRTYLKYHKSPRGTLSPSPVFASLMKLSNPHPNFHVQKRIMTNEPTGKHILLTKKSSMSIIALPGISCAELQILKPSAHGIERSAMIMPFTMPLFLRSAPRRSIENAMMFSNTPIIVAINKCDLPDAKPERIMQQLSDIGLMPEEWGGQTLYCKISALKKLGIDDLLDTILLQAEMMELKANPNCRAEGRVLEARIEQGRGTVATVLIQKGTLHVGDYYCAGIYAGRARAIFDDKGQKIQEAGPSTPIEIIGLSSIPKAGDPFQVTEDEKQARMVSAKRQELERLGATENTNKVTLSNLSEKIKEGDIKTLNLVIKGDLQGSVEALQQSLEKLSTPEIRLAVIRAAAGAIIESDVTLASASNALIIGFNVRPTPRALALAAEEKVEIRKYNIIYDVVDDVKAAMEGMLSPVTKEIDLGTAEVRNIFRVPKVGVIAGCMVTSGKVTRDAMVRVIRDNIQINKENIKISSLKRFKDDAKEVAEGFECGIGLENFQDLQVGDVLEIVGTQEVARKLEDTMTPQAAEEAKQLEARQ